MGDISDRAKINRARLAEVFNSPAESESVIWDEEEWWIRHEPWLKSRGYVLRPRFRPGWKPSWHTAKNPHALWGAEDRIHIGYPFLLDATRTSDGAVVMFKRVDKTRHPKEVELTTMLSSPPFTSDPRNHCVPVYEVLQDPEDDKYQLMVLPLLRRYSDPRFDTVGEAVICFRQIIQCLQFLHENQITHRDFHRLNIMMDASPLFAVPFHPIRQTVRRDFKGPAEASYTRTERPVKYYIIDFGLSIRYESVDPPPSEVPVLGGDKSVPEFKGDDPSKRYGGLSKPYNPFPTDVYCLGNWIREDFLDKTGEVIRSKKLGFEFLRPLVDDMTQADPSARPNMDQVAERFESIVSSLSTSKLRSRVAKANDHPLYNMYWATKHWVRRVKLVAFRRPALPSPDS
ncbi:hypothetical protein K523DRAFT_247284 [Schizophyllum commune Tattone D]|nr:hypothetical protein K523DRAFT_247284 [Schizophyllum commune Tattone D]